MPKAILKSEKSKMVKNIFNKNASLILCKRFPIDYVGWVYIYCTKEKGQYCYHAFESDAYAIENTRFIPMTKCNGKVVARFWCDKVERAYHFYVKELCQLACITEKKLYKYAGGWEEADNLLVIHINKLEIFDKPKEISEFKHLIKYTCNTCPHFAISNGVAGNDMCAFCEELKPLTRAPRSWCYIEI